LRVWNKCGLVLRFAWRFIHKYSNNTTISNFLCLHPLPSILTRLNPRSLLQAGYMLYDRVLRPAEVGVTQEVDDNKATEWWWHEGKPDSEFLLNTIQCFFFLYASIVRSLIFLITKIPCTMSLIPWDFDSMHAIYMFIIVTSFVTSQYPHWVQEF